MLTHANYINICVGYFNKKLREERIERRSQWISYLAVADLKKHPTTIEKWWPIYGDEVQPTFKMPSKKRLQQINNWVKNLGKSKS